MLQNRQLDRTGWSLLNRNETTLHDAAMNSFKSEQMNCCRLTPDYHLSSRSIYYQRYFHHSRSYHIFGNYAILFYSLSFFMLPLLSSSKYSPFRAMHQSRSVFHCSKVSGSSRQATPFNASTDCFLHLFHICKMVFLQGIFHSEEQKKSREQDRVENECG